MACLLAGIAYLFMAYGYIGWSCLEVGGNLKAA
jgi:hypothetical protein